MEFIPVLVLILIIIYIINMFARPEKHKVGLVILAIIVGIFSIFGDSSDKKNKW